MPTTASSLERITSRIIAAIEQGQTPPWRKPWRPDLENTGFPTHPATLKPLSGVDVLLANTAAMEQGLHSKFWDSEDGWRDLDSTVSGHPTILADGTPVYNADQTRLSLGSVAYRSRKRRTPVAVDYAQAEAVIKASGADIRHVVELEAAYYYQDDFIVFPEKWQFEQGPGGLVAYYDSLFHELAHHTEPRLRWDGPSIVRELRSEIAAPFMASQLGIPVLADMKKLPNHRKHLDRWRKAMRDDPTLIFTVAADASEAVSYLLSSAKAATS